MLLEEKGLTAQEAQERLKKFGPNVLPEKPPPSDIRILISQLKNPLVYVLVVAGLVTFVLGHTSDTIVIFIAILINTALGFFQERKAGRALYALKKLIHPKANVVRDGQIRSLEVEDIVLGDLIILHQGDKVPADGVIFDENRFFVSEAILTGESVPVAKKKNDKVYMGTIVTSGQAKLLVKVTGKETEIGKIAARIQEPEEETPLKLQLKRFSKHLVYLVLILTLFIFVVGILTGRGFLEIFTTGVALAVSAIPEGLLVGLTVVLAIGMQRILARKGLVKKLISAETLGGVTTICIDKTGTLTQGKMQVVDVIGDRQDVVKQVVLANDLDDPLVIAAWEWAQKNSQVDGLTAKHKRFDSIPFSSKQRFFASLNYWSKDKNVIFVNGAPEFVLEWTILDKKEKEIFKKQVEELSSQGKRVIGLARKFVTPSKMHLSHSDIDKNLDWVGILAFSDPVREGVQEALQKTLKAGIRLIVITGDYPQTAVSVIKKLGLKLEKDNILLGEELKSISEEKLKNILKGDKTILFARTTPEQKFTIVKALKGNGEVVAMMGDGVNDAPALTKADIGVVVGEATDVAKETADLVLLDSSFATIIAAIEEGRVIFDNIRKIILYLMCDAFGEIVAVCGTILLGLPLPVTAAQILWINLVSDGFPHLALTVDPKRQDIMDNPPRSPKTFLIENWMKLLIFIVSVVAGVMALFLFIVIYLKTGDLPLSRSVAFATLGVNSLIYVFSIRTLKKPFWFEDPLENKWLNIAVIAGFVFQLAPFLVKPLGTFLGIVTLTGGYWFLIVMTGVLMFIIIEVTKSVLRHRKIW